MYYVGGNLISERIYEDPVALCIGVCKEMQGCSWLYFMCLGVWNRCLLTALRKLT